MRSICERRINEQTEQRKTKHKKKMRKEFVLWYETSYCFAILYFSLCIFSTERWWCCFISVQIRVRNGSVHEQTWANQMSKLNRKKEERGRKKEKECLGFPVFPAACVCVSFFSLFLPTCIYNSLSNWFLLRVFRAFFRFLCCLLL